MSGFRRVRLSDVRLITICPDFGTRFGLERLKSGQYCPVIGCPVDNNASGYRTFVLYYISEIRTDCYQPVCEPDVRFSDVYCIDLIYDVVFNL